MNNDNDIRLTFSQRVGKAPLPEPMRLEHLPERFRNYVWLCIDGAIEDSSIGNILAGIDTYPLSEVHRQIKLYVMDILGQPHDSMDHTSRMHKTLLRPIILTGEYHKVLTLIEFFLEKFGINNNNIEQLNEKLRRTFELVTIAYTVQTIEKLPTIVPRSTLESGTATACAIETVEQKGSDGAKAHLRKAVEHLNAKHYADSVRESIHAVESVARTIDPRASAKLGPALTSLEKAGVLKHGVFKEALEKLYGYTNSEEGIRHPLLDEGAADVDLDDAVFMFSACAALSAYLLNRHRQIT